MRVCVSGAAGMLGGHMVKRMLDEGHEVLATDIKPEEEWFQWHKDALNIPRLDLKRYENAKRSIFYEADEVYNFAYHMGGVNWMSNNPMACNFSSKITQSMLEAAIELGVDRFWQAGSACCYPVELQSTTDVIALKESDAWKGRPEIGYGDAKLADEATCQTVGMDTDMKTRMGRYHNIYATHGSIDNEKGKAPLTLSRKVAEAVISGNHEIEIWGDGHQVRSFCYVDDCLDGTIKLMRSDYTQPLNIGSSEMVSINQLVSIIEDIAGVKLERNYNLDAPTGVRGRSSDNTLVKEVLDWEPTTSLREGLEIIYPWVYDTVNK